MSPGKIKEDPQNALLGDLESIRTLLDDEDDDAPPAPRLEDPEVPVLEDVVELDAVGGDSVPDSRSETAPTGDRSRSETAPTEDTSRSETAPTEGESRSETAPTGDTSRLENAPAGAGLDDDLFRALLSDQWRESANEVLKQARSVIHEHRTDWSPEETDTLNDALKVRIDATIQGWMRGMVVTHMADLHRILLEALSEELKTTISAIIEQRKETTDGQ